MLECSGSLGIAGFTGIPGGFSLSRFQTLGSLPTISVDQTSDPEVTYERPNSAGESEISTPEAEPKLGEGFIFTGPQRPLAASKIDG